MNDWNEKLSVQLDKHLGSLLLSEEAMEAAGESTLQLSDNWAAEAKICR